MRVELCFPGEVIILLLIKLPIWTILRDFAYTALHVPFTLVTKGLLPDK